MEDLLKNLPYKKVTTGLSVELYAMTEFLAKNQGYTVEEYVEYALPYYLSVSKNIEFIQWGEKIKHFQKNPDTLIYETSNKVPLTFMMGEEAYTAVEKLARCRGMCVVKWIENHLDIFYQGRIDGDKIKQYMNAGRNEDCPCGSGLKFKKCCGSLKNKGRKFGNCLECPYVDLMEDNEPFNLCKDAHCFN